ncbi:MAG: DUF928 domain-containing protein [Geitlerinemataceae cyanobacterium]
MLKTKLKTFLFLLVSVFLAAAIIVTWQVPSYSVEFNPPDRGAPGRLVGAGTRFSQPMETTRGSSGRRQAPITVNGETLTTPLVALVPSSSLGNYGLTLDGYPSFYIHMPALPEARLEFILLDELGDRIYETSYLVANREGTFSIDLPRNANLQPLEVGITYTWQVRLKLNPNRVVTDYLVQGQIERFDAEAVLAQDLEAASPEEKLVLYAQSGLWYDALDTLAQLRRANPNNPLLVNEWAQLLRSAGFDEIADEPLI